MTFADIHLNQEVYLSRKPGPLTAKGIVVCPVALGAVPGEITVGVKMTTTKGERIVVFMSPKFLTPTQKGK